MEGLKEWATVVKALEQGKQTVILRKGGILETASGFNIESNEIINQLSSFHIWSDSYIQERRNWKPEKPMKAVFLKIMKVPEFDLPLKSEFSGCKSWIELNSNFQDTEWMVRRRRRELALEADEIERKLQEFKEIVK